MPYVPKKSGKSEGGSGFLGVKPVGIVSIVEETDRKSDVFLVVELMQDGSKYTDKMRIMGDWKRDDDGNITNDSLARKVYNLFEVVGDGGGVNIKGDWVTKTDEVIDDVSVYLTSKYGNGDGEYPYLAYIFKEKNKTNGKVYTSVYPRLFPNTADGMKDIKSYIQYLKSKGYLIEESDIPERPQQTNRPTYQQNKWA